VREALAPKRDDKGQSLKWAAVCCAASEGLPPGDPAFNAWVRLASTPVRRLRSIVGSDRPDDRRGGRRGPRSGGGGRRDDRGGDRQPRREGGRDRGGRSDRGPRVSGEDLAAYASQGSVGASIRIVEDDRKSRKEREKQAKADRDAKLQAERERLARLGY
jgi:hypothetical protein